MSSHIFSHLIDHNNIDFLDSEDEIMIKNLIKGENPYKHVSFEDNNNCIKNITYIILLSLDL